MSREPSSIAGLPPSHQHSSLFAVSSSLPYSSPSPSIPSNTSTETVLAIVRMLIDTGASLFAAGDGATKVLGSSQASSLSATVASGGRIQSAGSVPLLFQASSSSPSYPIAFELLTGTSNLFIISPGQLTEMGVDFYFASESRGGAWMIIRSVEPNLWIRLRRVNNCWDARFALIDNGTGQRVLRPIGQTVSSSSVFHCDDTSIRLSALCHISSSPHQLSYVCPMHVCAVSDSVTEAPRRTVGRHPIITDKQIWMETFGFPSEAVAQVLHKHMRGVKRFSQCLLLLLML
mmetsp:Transcript_9382/g.11302  ORF Transcript_9382/g.11302 Transcript_9382/m.11302 type:complete len:289 (+) Transcript_9382:2997-3863(+)